MQASTVLLSPLSILLKIMATAWLILASLVTANVVWAQNAPGEDPVLLTRRVTVLALPTGPARASDPLDNRAVMPSWLRAKVARFEAKASSGFSPGIYSDADVSREVTSDGFKKTCIQEVGSNTTSPSSGSPKYGQGNTEQIVVLKGDLVNICK